MPITLKLSLPSSCLFRPSMTSISQLGRKLYFTIRQHFRRACRKGGTIVHRHTLALRSTSSLLSFVRTCKFCPDNLLPLTSEEAQTWGNPFLPPSSRTVICTFLSWIIAQFKAATFPNRMVMPAGVITMYFGQVETEAHD